MEKEKLYHIALDDYEHGVVIRSLNDEKTKLMEEGKSADAVDDLLVKVGNAPLKKFKVIERKCYFRNWRNMKSMMGFGRVRPFFI